MEPEDGVNVYQVCDKKTGEKLVRLTSDCVKRARWKFYSTKGFSHYPGPIVVKLVGRTEPESFAASSRVTHKGNRDLVRGQCEKCKTATNWTVNVSGRSAYWCGCE